MRRLLASSFCFAFMLAASCRTATDRRVEIEQAPAEAETALPVVAVVDQIERNGYQDFLTDGSVISWTLVTFTVVGPDAAWGTTVRAYCTGHPVLGSAPLLIGQAVTFDLPSPAARNALPLEQLSKLQRSE